MFNLSEIEMKKIKNYLVIALFAAGVISVMFTSCNNSTEDVTDQLDDLIENLDSTIVEIENNITIEDTIVTDSTIVEDMEEVVE